jgi:hypothetical protein
VFLNKQLQDRIAHLERLLDEERDKNSRLIEQVVSLSYKAPIPMRDNNGEATVYFMDDSRLVELEKEGRGPTT